MKKDNRAIFAAAAKASEATNYLLAFLRQEQAHAA
jgi:antirestriction protein ArdC